MATPPRVKNPKNVTARELAGYDDTLVPETPGEPEAPGGGLEPVTVALPFQTGGDVDVFVAQGADAADPGWPVERYDARGHTQIRVVTTVETAGHTTAELYAESSSDGTSWSTPGASSTDVRASLATTGPKPLANQGWVDLDATAIADRLWRLRLRGGNAVLSPALWGSHLQFRQQQASRPPRATPTDPVWGAVVFDIDASGAAFTALGYADDADVAAWPDETARGNNMGSDELLLLPTYQATGFNGAHPCVEWAGGNVPLLTDNNPTEPYGSYTYYFVLEALDGGDGAMVWGAGLGDSFQYDLLAYDSELQAANNNLFGAPSITATDDWGMSGAHIYRWVKSAGSASHYLFVDGVLKDSAGAAPQGNNGGVARLMDLMSGIGLAGRVAQVRAYDRAHLSADNTGPVADGLTGPELTLQAAWGL